MWATLIRKQHFPVELYRRDRLTNKIAKVPEPQDWILELKTTAEERKEKQEAFLENLRSQKNNDVNNELKFQIKKLKGEKKDGIAGQSQVKQKAKIDFFVKKKKQKEKENELKSNMSRRMYNKLYGDKN